MAGIPSDTSYAYFVHSYHASDVPEAYIIATTDYGYNYPSIIGKGNVMGVQFHPEKSQSVGLRLLKNFCEMR
jgi:glutamine amidotransferase